MHYVTAGESHGMCLTAIITDVPAGICVPEDAINGDLVRRSSGYGRSARQKIEHDRVVFTGGIAQGKTTGAPVSLMIENACARDVERNVCPRPGHADLAGAQKYGFDECSLVAERASARETAVRVAAAGIAKQFLTQLGIDIVSFTTSVGTVCLDKREYAYASVPYTRAQIESSAIRCPDERISARMIALIDDARAKGTTLGGTFSVIVSGLPSGIGDYAQGCERLSAQLGGAVLSIPSVKGVSFGTGFESASMTGSDYVDEIAHDGSSFFRSQNNNGGLEGGMTNGMPLVVHAVCKPVPTMAHPASTINLDTMEPCDAQVVRSDVCVVDAAAVIAEGEIAFVLARALMHKFGSDSFEEIEAGLCRYRQRLAGMTR